ncbi:MAG: hypothetical protein Tsb0016_27560 [Sphingomonadales bacterium]
MTRTKKRILFIFLAFWAALTFAVGYGLLWRFAGVLNAIIFWIAFAWVMVLLLLVLAVTLGRLLAPPVAPLTVRTGLHLKPGAAIASWVFALASAALLWAALSDLGEGLWARAFVMLQMLLLAAYVLAMGWRFVDYFVGLPANAGLTAAQNADRLENYIDQIAYFATSPWLAGARGVTAAGRLRATLAWWEEALVAAFPRLGLEMALPAVSRFIDQLGSDVAAIELLHQRHAQRQQHLEEAERRALDGIRRAEQVAGRLLI